MTLHEIFEEASGRHIELISITDHDSIDCQESAKELADQYGIQYLYGLELNVSFSHPGYRNSKYPISSPKTKTYRTERISKEKSRKDS
jgi:predicted metal-dependent phosphoesterase TrpH